MFSYDHNTAVTLIDLFEPKMARSAWHEKPIWQPDFDVSNFHPTFFDTTAATTALEDIISLDENWDGYGALRISSKTADNSRNALREVLFFLPSPDITPNPHGTISFEWESENGLAHLEIGANRYSLFVKPSIGSTLFFDGQANEFDRSLSLEISGLLFPNSEKNAVTETGVVFGEAA